MNTESRTCRSQSACASQSFTQEVEADGLVIFLGPLRASLKKLRLLFDTGRGLAVSTCQSNKPSSLNGSGGGVANANVPPLHACGTARQECGDSQNQGAILS